MIERIGNHIVRCGSITDDLSGLMEGAKPYIIYTDPPWGEGNLRYWDTINQRQNPGMSGKTIDFLKFLSSVFSFCSKYGSGFVFIEYGIQWKDLIIDEGRKAGLSHHATIDIRYKSGSKFLPHHLHVFTNKGFPIQGKIDKSYIESVSGTSGIDTLRKAIYPVAIHGRHICDPCCGKGYTARIAVETGMSFIGNELNMARLVYTIAFLKKSL